MENFKEYVLEILIKLKPYTAIKIFGTFKTEI